MEHEARKPNRPLHHLLGRTARGWAIKPWEAAGRLALGPIEASNLITVTGEQIAADQGRTVPATGITEKLPGINLDKFFRVGFDYAEGTCISENNQFVIDQKHPSVSILASPPFQLAIGGIQTSEGILIEAVNESVLENGVGKLALEIL